MPVTDPFGNTEEKPAPDALGLVQALINTWDIETGADLLGETASAQQWLSDNGLAETADAEQIEVVIGVREALRALAVHNAGGLAPSAEALQGLRAVVAHSTARAELGADGSVHLEPTTDTVYGRLLRLVLVVRDAQADGTWAHLKACANPQCQWAFYDRSRNHGGTWCAMSGCGNKLKNREFRARRRSATAKSPGSGGGVPDQSGRQRAQAVE